MFQMHLSSCDLFFFSEIAARGLGTKTRKRAQREILLRKPGLHGFRSGKRKLIGAGGGFLKNKLCQRTWPLHVTRSVTLIPYRSDLRVSEVTHLSVELRSSSVQDERGRPCTGSCQATQRRDHRVCGTVAQIGLCCYESYIICRPELLDQEAEAKGCFFFLFN